MGKFDGVIIATDFDGTFYCNREIKEENLEAIRYFTENGGKFTVCSGRGHRFLLDFEPKLPINTYTIAYNGARIVDTETEAVIYKEFCDRHLFDILDRIVQDALPYLNATFSIERDGEDVTVVCTMEEYVALKDSLMEEDVYKVVLRAPDEASALRGVETVNGYELFDYIAVRSWGLSLEFMKRENSKGAAVRRLADKLGSKLIVAVGDYENDIEMLKAADISYAVENAIDEVKRIADRQTVRVNESAIAHIIYDIEKDIDNKTIVL
jgi:Cof subfamily protein (haloacid dehalogenase superfamily)